MPWYKVPLERFRVIAIAEGISFLLLLSVAMPLKYLAGFPHAVFIVGWIHGLLFIAYMLSGLDVKMTYNWNLRKTGIAVLAALIPFGPFVLDKRILQKEKTSNFISPS